MSAADSARSLKPVVTLAVTTLNRTKYLREALASVLAQDYSSLDILISDNGSSDDTHLVTRTLVQGDTRVRLRRNETTVPLHIHFNQCVRAARGEYFILLHDDDRINTCFVSELVDVATRYPDVNTIVPANIIIDETGAVIRKMTEPAGEVFDGPTFVCDWLATKDIQVLADATTVLFRKRVVLRFDGYHSLGGSGRNVDNLLFLQCAITSRVGFARDAIFFWRRHAVSFGSGATPLQIADAGRQSLRHLRRDPPTVDALDALPLSTRKWILRRIGEVTALEAMSQLSSGNPVSSLRTVVQILVRGRDLIFCYVMIREFVRRSSPTLYYRLRRVATLIFPGAN